MSSIHVIYGREAADIPADGGGTLLSVLRAAGYTLPAACGGKGRCGKCRVRVNGVPRLACRVTPRDGDEVILPESGGGRILTESVRIDAHSPRGESGLAAAVDLGTTTVAVRVYGLADGRELGTRGAWNAQAPYGADVISRIEYALSSPGHARELTGVIRRQTEELLRSIIADAGADVRELRRTVLCGNTVMQHLFAGLPVAGLAKAPFAPETLFCEDFPDEILGAPLVYAPCVAGYVGGDIVSGLLASGVYRMPGENLFLDIGTNGEIVLGGMAGLCCCAVASGPAFEGAGVSHGMPAQDGAVSHVRYEHGFLCDVLGGGEPRGICGSGLCDLVAALCDCDVISPGGRLLPPGEVPLEMRRYLTCDENGNGVFHLSEEVSLTAGDVRALQVAKAAVAGGISVLTALRGIEPQALDSLCLAGGFGSFLSPRSAERIGMLPHLPHERIHTFGNTALAGASVLALEPERLAVARKIAGSCKYVELSGRRDFAEAFAGSMGF